ncbi:alpha/beta hydrolase family protein [Cupriavidus nantongensis]|uniref:Alpha/beta hydrolase n=1 Tax=Cupriavidus nantongensis TaxID=1796606 RepID=A0A142JV68_9BURK|nr:alpha/beta hydrolase [Cupriavidus nantongensis]AMR81980.1 alpha/beta hydrolase [Cupriavidus nantongensis]
MKRAVGKAAMLCLAATLLYGCGGDDDEPAQSPPPQAEEKRPQDDRTFTMDAATLPFAALAGAPEADRWWGVQDGAGYRIEVPKNWNGRLVMYAHGYAGTGAALSVTLPSIRRHLLANGYAWAASSYAKNYYDVRAGLEDTNALALAFTRIAAQNGRTLAAPSRLYIIGHSMGGHISAAAVDEENIQAANHKVRYHGAVPMCGVLGDTELFNYFGAYQTAAQQLAGYPVTAWPAANWAQIAPAVRAALFTTYPGQTTAQGDTLKAIVRNLTGGQRPLFDWGFGGPGAQGLQDAVWSTFGQDGSVNGILTQNVVNTTGITFQFDNDPAQSVAEQSFNAGIFRVTGSAEANRARSDGLRWIPRANARIGVPVVTLHTLGDMYVPFSMEQIYKRRADANGTAQWLVQRAIRGVSHCDFTVAEQARAFDDMVNWEQNGVKPAGDEVLDAATVANPAYGCKFTDNTLASGDESQTTAALRPSVAQAFPCAPG